MSEQLSAVLWEVALFILPAIALLVAAGHIRFTKPREGDPQQKPNGWTIAAAVVLAGPILASGAAAVSSWTSGVGAYGFVMWSGIGLLLLAGLVLGFIHARAAGLTLVVLSFVLPAVVAVTGGAWMIDDQAGTPTPESAFLGALSVAVLFSLPALVSGGLLLLGSRPGDGPTDAQASGRAHAADSSWVSNHHVMS